MQPVCAPNRSTVGAQQPRTAMSARSVGEPHTPRGGSAAVAPSVAEARHFLLSLLPEGCGESADTATLMLSELATNAVQHASTDFEVAIDVAPDGRHVRVAVSDAAESFPVPQDTDTESSDGRGLHIVRELADAWGIDVRRGRPGKTVWFWLLLAGPGRP